MFGASALLPVIGAEQLSTPPFSPDSKAAWIGAIKGVIDFEPPPSGPGPVRNDPAHPYVSNPEAAATGKQPTYRVADLSNPILQPWARDEMKKKNDNVLAGKAEFTADATCWPQGVPTFLLVPVVNPLFFVQTPAQVLMFYQGNAEVRRVHLNQAHSAAPKPSWHGESVGHYENGDTLVVDTIGFVEHALSFVDNYRTPHTKQLHVIERFRLIDGGQGIDVSVHVEDRGAFTTPWNAVRRFRRIDNGPMIEQRCAENTEDYFHNEVVRPPHDEEPDF